MIAHFRADVSDFLRAVGCAGVVVIVSGILPPAYSGAGRPKKKLRRKRMRQTKAKAVMEIIYIALLLRVIVFPLKYDKISII